MWRQQKKRLLNYCLCIYFTQKRKEKVQDKASPEALYQLGLYSKFAKHLFAHFSSAGIIIQQQHISGMVGSYVAYLNDLFKWAKLDRPDLGSRPNRASVNLADDEKIRSAVAQGALHPYHNPMDMLRLLTYLLTRDIALRGGTEVSFIQSVYLFWHCGLRSYSQCFYSGVAFFFLTICIIPGVRFAPAIFRREEDYGRWPFQRPSCLVLQEFHQ